MTRRCSCGFQFPRVGEPVRVGVWVAGFWDCGAA